MQDLKEFGIETVTFLDIENETIESLQAADVIYLNGGNPFVLLYFLRKSGADRLIQKRAKEDCAVVGVSAGAVVLGSSIQIVEWFSPELNTIKLENLTGCQLYNFSIFPHADRADLFPHNDTIETRILAFEKASNERVIRLADDEFQLLTI